MSQAAERLAAARAAIAESAALHAFISLSTEEFEGSAQHSTGPIVAVKDLIDVAGLPTSGGSLSRRDAVAAGDAPVIARVRVAGGVVIGKANLYEWAFGVTGHNPHYGDVVNPWDSERTAGGSSGGSAVAVAKGMADWAIGTDTGGSIRIPASLCGVVGFKPTRGLIGTTGVLPLAHSLDTLGPLARDVRTAVGALEILAGEPLPLVEGLRPRLAVPRGWVQPRQLDRRTRGVWLEVSRGLPEIAFPPLERMNAAARTVLEWEASSLHDAALSRAPETYGQEVRERLRRVLRDRHAGSREEYKKALFEMSELTVQVESALEGWDAVLLPASACVAPLNSEGGVREPLVRFMRPFNLTGHPAIVIPGPAVGLPVGVQIVGRLREEARLASVALELERSWLLPKFR